MRPLTVTALSETETPKYDVEAMPARIAGRAYWAGSLLSGFRIDRCPPGT